MKPHLKQSAALALVVLLLGVMGVAAADNDKEVTTSSAPTVQEQLQQQQVRIAELERLLKKQAELLEQLQEQVAAKETEPQPAPNSASTAAPAVQGVSNAQEVDRISSELDAVAENQRALNDKVNQFDKKIADSEKTLGGKLKGLGNFSFGGDLRLRYEPFRGGGSPSRNRVRFRARFDIKNKFSDEFSAGLRIATGGTTDPISTNQTITDFYERKNFRLDRAYMTYTPNWAKPFSIVGGKFAYTWKRTELTFDSDLNPEGFSPKLSFNIEDMPLTNITFVGYGLPFRESGSGGDSYMMGGGIETHWKLGSRAKFTGAASFSDWFRADAIRAAQTSGGLSGSSNSNAASAAAFASRFALLDLIAQLDIDTGVKRWPVMFLFDYVNNTRACANVSIAGVACNANDRQGYWAEFAVGSTSLLHGVKAGYTLIHIEREAVLAAFNFSDLRQPTQVLNHRFSIAYQAYKNITLGYTLLVGRELGTNDPWLKRSQVDVVYKF